MSCLAAENVWDGGDWVVDRHKATKKQADAAIKVLRDHRTSVMAKALARKSLGLGASTEEGACIALSALSRGAWSGSTDVLAALADSPAEPDRSEP